MTLTIESPAGPCQTLYVQPTHFTRRAERQVRKLLRELSPGDREQLVADLPRPVPYRVRDIITCRKKHRLFHFRMRCEVAIRVCYLLLSGADAVILDVQPHDGFEKYIRNFTGSYGTVIPIEEARIMKHVTTNGIAPRTPKNVIPAGVPVIASRAPHPVTPPSSSPPAIPASDPPCVPSGPDATPELFFQLILRSAAFKKKFGEIDDTIEKFAGDVCNDAVGTIKVTLRNIEDRLTGQAAEFEWLQAMIEGLQSGLNGLTAGFATHRGEIDASLQAMRESFASGEAGLDVAIASCDRDIATTKACVSNLEERLGYLDRKFEARLGVIERPSPRTARPRSPHAWTASRRTGSCLVCREAGRDASLATAIDQLDECREGPSTLQSTLAASDARARSLEDQVTSSAAVFQGARRADVAGSPSRASSDRSGAGWPA